MKRLFILLAALGSFVADGAIIYSNTTTDTGNTYQYSVNNYSALGDQILLGGTARFATQATTQFFNVLATPGTFSATLSLYTVGNGQTALGSLLASSTVSNIAISGFDVNNPLTTGTTDVTFSGLNVTVPDNLIFVLMVANVVNADLGVTIFDPPTVGSSNSATYISATGNVYSVTTTDSGFGNLNFSLTAAAATPEPSTLSAIALGLGLLVFARRNRRAA